MPIPYSEPNSPREAGTAGFLKFVEEDSTIQAALFMVSSTGAPIDFSFTKVDVNSSFLWRKGHAKREAITSLIKVLFGGTSRVPDLILALAEEVPARVFAEDITTQIPLCRISTDSSVVQAISEESENLNGSINLIWATTKPTEESVARNLLQTLSEHGILTEPFDRAAEGLKEASEK